MADLKLGSKGKEVIAVQKALIAFGIKPTVRTNGNFDKKTDEAVRAYQKKNGLKVDGIVGRRTRAKLDKASNGRKKNLKSNVPDYAKLMKDAEKTFQRTRAAGAKVIVKITKSTDADVKKIAKEYQYFYRNLHTDYRKWVKIAKAATKVQKEYRNALRNDPWTAEELVKKLDDVHLNGRWEMELVKNAIEGMERLNKDLARQHDMPIAA